jgi:molybdopterin molybdotransferase
VAVLAAVGRSEVRVAGAPSVALVATGDELVDLGSDVEPYQIRPSNSYAIRAALAREQIVDTHLFQVRDDRPTLVHVLADVLKRFAVVILSGGVSMGKYDFVPLVLEQLGVTCLFHKIRQKPGKPLWFGVTTEGQPVFALPGNPVSALVCFHRYVLPGLRQAMGLTAAPPVRIPLAIALDLNPALTHYWPVRLVPGPAGNPLAQPLDYQGSGDYVPLAQSDGFIELAEGAAHNPAGGSVPFFPWN